MKQQQNCLQFLPSLFEEAQGWVSVLLRRDDTSVCISVFTFGEAVTVWVRLWTLKLYNFINIAQKYIKKIELQFSMIWSSKDNFAPKHLNIQTLCSLSSLLSILKYTSSPCLRASTSVLLNFLSILHEKTYFFYFTLSLL